jgi:diguanylate cyclase (GGDEF)-like protein/PAS domain S-box-containing protein
MPIVSTVLRRLPSALDDGDPVGGPGAPGLVPGNRPLFDALIERAPVGVFLTDPDGACLYANACLCELTGVPFAQQLGHGWRKVLHHDDRERVAAAWDEATRAGASLAHDQRYVRPDGTIAWVEMTASAVKGEDGRVVGWAGVCVDVTERRLSDDRYRDLVERARDAIYAADATGAFVAVNRAAEEMTGFSSEELLGMSFFDLIAPEDAERAGTALARSFSGEDVRRIELHLVAKDGRKVFAEVMGRVVEEGGHVVGFEGIARDVTEQRMLQEQLTHQAFHDPLTGLPNRALLLDRLGHALAGAERPDAPIAVILLDLDNFKLVNDSLGHDAGDEILRALAPRLVHAAGAGDTVARMGGDEFGLVLETLHDEREAVAVAERIAAALETPFVVGSGTQRITASTGVVVARSGDEPSAILRNADTALYSAKARKKGGFEFFDDSMSRSVRRELELKNALADALERGRLQVYYQPIVALDDGGVLAVEALARWRHPEWGWVQPSEFIPVAERDGLIVRLDRFVFAEAVRQAVRWQEDSPQALPLGVFVNVCAQQLATDDYVDFVRSTLDAAGLSPAGVGMEVTERVFVDEHEGRVAANLAELVGMGIRLSLDDFGTGYSSLASLERFPFAVLKIDRYFIRSIRTPEAIAPISTAVVGLGRALGLTVIAEGVETETQAEYLRCLGCHAAQGYLYARPQPAEGISALLAGGESEEQPVAELAQASGI